MLDSWNIVEQDKDKEMSKSTLKSEEHVKYGLTKEADKILAPGKFEKYCTRTKEPSNLISTSTAPPQKIKNRETYQDKALHVEKEDWSSMVKWCTRQGRAADGLNMTFHSPSGSEKSSSSSTLELSTVSFSCGSSCTGREREPLSIYSCLESPHGSTLTSKWSLPDNGLEKKEKFTDSFLHGYIRTPPHVIKDNGHLANISSPLPLNHDTSIWSPEIWARTKNDRNNKSPVRASHGTVHSTSKIFSNVLMPSEKQSTIASELGVSRKPLSPVSKISGSFVAPNEEKISENIFLSNTETKHSHPSTSASTSYPSISQGLLHRGCMNGLPYYTFSLNESEQALVARTWKVNNCGRKDVEWIYTFHSGKDIKKKSNKSKWISSVTKDTHALDLVGRMRVSSSLHPEFNSFGSLEHTLETEFVLVGADIEPSNESTPIQDIVEKSSPFPDQLHHMITSSTNSSDLFSTSTAFPPLSNYLIQLPFLTYVALSKNDMMKKTKLNYPSGQSSQSRSFKSHSVKGNAAMLENGINSDMSDSEFCAFQPFLPHLELAAIVIRTPFPESKRVQGRAGKDIVSKDSGGWGLKFLEKSSISSDSRHTLHWQEHDSSCNSSDTASTLRTDALNFDDHHQREGHLRRGKQYQTSVTVVVPADMHGLPTIKSSRPSSLIERWRFNGNCDCGGWDIGCPVTLLQNQKQNGSDFIEANAIAEICHSLFVLFKGGKQDIPALRMTAVHEGLYFLSFQSKLSALQVFSISVALLHGTDPVMSKSKESLDVDK